MTQVSFKGTGVAIVTPFRDDKSIDFKSLGKLLHHLLENGIDYLVVMGTTGESVTLNKDEKRAVIDYVIEHVQKKVQVVVGFGGNNTQEVIRSIQENDFEGIDGILTVCPYYNKPNQQGLYEHFKAIANASPVPVILYNVPGRTGSNLASSTALKLAREVKKIVAIKEASGNLEQVMEIIKYKPDGFQLISGDDLLTLPIIALGGEGVISVVANAYPREFSDMVNFALAQKMKQARELHYLLGDMIIALFTEGSPAGVKAILSMMKIVPNNVRLPLTPVSKAHYDKLMQLAKVIRK
jgi:4-hydroxy-tetrahydrodipicolinate synthase